MTEQNKNWSSEKQKSNKPQQQQHNQQQKPAGKNTNPSYQKPR